MSNPPLDFEFSIQIFLMGLDWYYDLWQSYEGELLYLWIFSYLSPPNNFVKRKRELSFQRALKSCTHIGYPVENDNVRRSRRMITPNPKVQ